MIEVCSERRTSHRLGDGTAPAANLDETGAQGSCTSVQMITHAAKARRTRGPLKHWGGGAVIEEPYLPGNPDSTVAAPSSDDPQHQHDINEAGKSMLRDQFGADHRGPLRATPYGYEAMNGPATQPVYAKGSLEWQQQRGG
jgi:hypothetical protein